MGWTTVEDGHYVVRSAPAVYATSSLTTLLSNPDEDAVLADLAAGPANEAIALWTNGPRQAPSLQSVSSAPVESAPWESTTPPAAPAEPAQSELWEARTSIAPGDHVVLRPAEMIAPAGPVADPTVAVDPRNETRSRRGRWWERDPSVEYSVSAGASGYHPHPAVVRARRGDHGRRMDADRPRGGRIGRRAGARCDERLDAPRRRRLAEPQPRECVAREAGGSVERGLRASRRKLRVRSQERVACSAS